MNLLCTEVRISVNLASKLPKIDPIVSLLSTRLDYRATLDIPCCRRPLGQCLLYRTMDRVV
jgi:hypothetical protein